MNFLEVLKDFTPTMFERFGTTGAKFEFPAGDVLEFRPNSVRLHIPATSDVLVAANLLNDAGYLASIDFANGDGVCLSIRPNIDYPPLTKTVLAHCNALRLVSWFWRQVDCCGISVDVDEDYGPFSVRVKNDDLHIDDMCIHPRLFPKVIQLADRLGFIVNAVLVENRGLYKCTFSKVMGDVNQG